MKDGIIEHFTKPPLPSEPADRLDKIASYKISPEDDGNKITDYLLRHRQPMRYEDIFGLSRVFFFGEKHTSIEAKREIEELLPVFQSTGGTHIAMEMLHQDGQSILDRYKLKGDNEPEVRKQLERFNWGGNTLESYLAILQKARALGLNIIGLDVDTDTGGNYFQRHRNRNAAWASLLAGIIEANPNSKVLALSGRSGLHLGYNTFRDSVNQRLEDELKARNIDNIRPIVASFAHFDDDSDPGSLPEDLHKLPATIARIARDVNLSNKKFGVIVDNGIFGGRDTDIIIHLPEESTP
jgi:hypothetical protein